MKPDRPWGQAISFRAVSPAVASQSRIGSSTLAGHPQEAPSFRHAVSLVRVVRSARRCRGCRCPHGHVPRRLLGAPRLPDRSRQNELVTDRPADCAQRVGGDASVEGATLHRPCFLAARRLAKRFSSARAPITIPIPITTASRLRGRSLNTMGPDSLCLPRDAEPGAGCDNYYS
jgi:hypothetical protein